MQITINKEIKTIPDDIKNLDNLLSFCGIPRQGTAIALNGNLITACCWVDTEIKNNDSLTIISAAFGG